MAGSQKTSKPKPRLCFVVTSDLTAGTFLRGYLLELIRSGIAVTLICSPGPGLDRLRDIPGIAFHPVRMNREPSPIADMRAFFRLVMFLVRLKPDAVVYATPKASLLSSIAAFIAGVRVRIYELWGLRLETASGLPRFILVLLERLTLQFSTSVVANSESLLDRVRALGLLSNRSGTVLGPGSSHGVDTELFSTTASRPALDPDTGGFLSGSRGFTVGYIGRLHPDKGIDVVIEAVRAVHKRGVQVRALLVGGNEGADLPDMSRLQIHLAGPVEDVRPYLAEMDLLVLMSLREGFPNVVLEAASMGIPAVVSDSTGVRDAVVNGTTGYVVRTGDVAELAAAIIRLEADSDERGRMGQQSRLRAVKDFNSVRICRLHVRHYQREIANAASNGGRV